MPARLIRLIVIAVLGSLAIAIGTLLPFNGAFPPNVVVTPVSQAVIAVENLLWLVVAGIVAVRQPNRFWLLALALVGANEIWTIAYTGNSVLYFLSEAFAPVNTAVAAHLFLVFPDGRIRTRYDRRLIAIGYGVVAINAAADLFLKSGYSDRANPFVLVPADDLGQAVQHAAGLAVPLVGLGLLLGVWRHWHAATPATRRALRPLLFAVPVFYLVASLGYVADNQGWDAVSALMRTPAIQATAIITPLGYLLGVIRARLGRGRLADLATALGRGIPIGGLRGVLARAIDDPTLELAFADGSGAYRDSAGQPVEVASADGRTPRSVTRVERDGRLLAVLVHDPMIDTEDPGLVAAVGSMAALALDNERLAAEVRAQLEEVRGSRARIAEAADDERRRVERDLHDGAQQRLVALTMRLEQARASGGGSAALIDTTTAELRAAIDEVRQIARGMHPPILTESGLAAAVESLAERMPLPVAVRVTPARVPPQIEAAAYYVVAEALTNAVRHAGATAATVDGEIREGRLELSITDDGLGGAEVGGGTGLQGLRDRVGAVDGTFVVASSPGTGTTLRASIPVPEAAP